MHCPDIAKGDVKRGQCIDTSRQTVETCYIKRQRGNAKPRIFYLEAMLLLFKFSKTYFFVKKKKPT